MAMGRAAGNAFFHSTEHSWALQSPASVHADTIKPACMLTRLVLKPQCLDVSLASVPNDGFGQRLQAKCIC